MDPPGELLRPILSRLFQEPRTRLGPGGGAMSWPGRTDVRTPMTKIGRRHRSPQKGWEPPPSSPLHDRVSNARITLICAAIVILITGLVALPALTSLFTSLLSFPSFQTTTATAPPNPWHVALTVARRDLPVSAAIAASLLLIAVSLRRVLRKQLERSLQNTVEGPEGATEPWAGPSSPGEHPDSSS